MKKLVVSCKTSDQFFDDFKTAYKAASGRVARKAQSYELSFDNKKDFNRFVTNIPVLAAILDHKPGSIYELAKILKMDLSNLAKTIDFFEQIGVIEIKTTKISGRTQKQPQAKYNEITFRLTS